MKQQLTIEQLKELEQQLSHPKGENGIALGAEMHRTNIGMTRAAIAALKITDENQILEIGHGSCNHLPEILNQANTIHYTGIEISETMHQVAKKNYPKLVENKKARFLLYNGLKLPFVKHSFDRMMTVNTIYFWKNPLEFLNEIHQVLKPNGICSIAIAHKRFMKELPFVQDKFRMFDEQDLINLAKESNFKTIDLTLHEGIVESKSGEIVNREFLIALLRKK